MGSCLLANFYLPCGGLNYFFTYWSYFHLIRNFYFFPDFHEVRPTGSEKHKTNLAWPNDIAKVTTDNTLITTDNPRDTTDSAIQVYNLAGKIELHYLQTSCYIHLFSELPQFSCTGTEAGGGCGEEGGVFRLHLLTVGHLAQPGEPVQS